MCKIDSGLGLLFIFSFILYQVGSAEHADPDKLYLKALGESDPHGQIRLFHKVLNAEPGNVGACNNIALAYKTLGRLDSAVFYLERAESLCAIPQVLNNLGNWCLSRNDTLSARNYYELALKREPENSYAHFNYANLLWQAGKRHKALSYYKESMSGKQASEVMTHLPAEVVKRFLMDDARKRLSRDFIEKVIVPDFSPVGINSGFQEPLKTLPDKRGPKAPFTTLSNDTGNVLYMLGKYDWAKYYYLQAIEQEPFCLNARINLALCYFREKKYLRCIDELDFYFFWKGIVRECNFSGHAHEIFVSRYCEGLPAIQVKIYSRMLGNGRAVTGNQAYVQYVYGKSQEESGNELKAVLHYRQALTLDANMQEALLAMSAHEYGQGRVVESIELLSKGLGRKKRPVIHLGFGGHYNPDIYMKYPKLLAAKRM